ncbi:MAG: hypothetical protein ACYC4L_16550, partial [Chloroflexota bacterium]
RLGATDMSDGGSTFAGGESVLMQGVSGTTWEALRAESPRVATLVDHQVRGNGANLLALGLLSAVVSWTALRRGERWAWYAMWVWPLWTALVVFLTLRVEKVPGAGTPIPAISGSIFFVITVLALLLSYRKYFPSNGRALPKE